MAFLCPVRIRRSKKKKGGGNGYSSEGEEKVVRPVGMGRITGSASIETLVRVGLEKEAGLSPDSKMIVLQDFTPCVDDELEVKRGNIVNVLYQENDWVYVIADNGQHEGFIPHSYCTPYNSQLSLTQKKKMPREQSGLDNSLGSPDHNTTIGTHNSVGTGLTMDLNNGSYVTKMSHDPNGASDTILQSGGSNSPDVYPFFKDPAGRFIVLYTFIARDENDVSVERGEFVTVLNKEDPEWYWIVRSDGQEGFVPSGFVYPADLIQGLLPKATPNNFTNLNAALIRDHLQHVGTAASGMHPNLPSGINPVGTNHSGYSNSSPHHLSNNEELRFHGTELVMLYDYKAQAPDDLSVRRGDWIYADLTDQTVDGWLWAYAPKTRKYGFIPKAYARPPAMTSL